MIKSSLNTPLQTTQDAEKDLQTSRQVQDNLAQAIRPGNDAAAPQAATGAWGVAISADNEAGEGQFGVNKAKEQCYGSVSLYDRQGWLRMVIEFPDASAAQAALSSARTKLPNAGGAYALNLDGWCPNRAATGADAYRCP